MGTQQPSQLGGGAQRSFRFGREIHGDQHAASGRQTGPLDAGTDQQHRHSAMMDQVVRHRSSPEPAESPAAVRGHHDEIGPDPEGLLTERWSGRAIGLPRFNRPQSPTAEPAGGPVEVGLFLIADRSIQLDGGHRDLRPTGEDRQAAMRQDQVDLGMGSTRDIPRQRQGGFRELGPVNWYDNGLVHNPPVCYPRSGPDTSKTNTGTVDS